MNRQIRFRGKRKDNGEWVYGFYVILNETHAHFKEHYILTGKSQMFYGSGTSREIFEKHEVDPETVGQFTGLHDKNGKEIYEDDILKGDFATGAGGISTKYKSFNFAMLFYVGNNQARFGIQMPEDYGKYRFHPYINQSEVIGNINNNPELLKP